MIERLVTEQIDEVTRTVVIGDRGETMVPAVATLSQTYPTDVDDLWDACTTTDRLARWFAPVDGDLTVGGRFQVQGNAGGSVVACDRPKRFEVTWEMAGASSSLVIDIAADGAGRSRLTLIHSGEVPIEFWDQFGPGATGVGWDLTLLGLALHTKTGADKPAESSEWGTSDSAKGFMATSADRWCDAAIAAGADEAGARSGGEATKGFYLGG